MHQRLPAWWATPLIGAFGGWLASLANWPLPWMVGSLLAVIAVRCSGWLVSEVPRGRQVGQWIVASAIGLHFTGEVMREVLAHFGVILAGAVGTLLLGLIGIFILLRSGSDRATAFFASMPGGASEMVVLANRHQAEAASVAAAHSLRLLLVVLIVPALFTWGLPTVAAPPAAPVSWPWLAVLLPAGGLLALLWKRLGQPNPWMLGPLTACALASHFDRPFFRSAPAFLLRILLFTLLAMLVAAALGGALGWLTALDEVSLMLGMMPGGITELCLTAEALQLSVALVTAVQVLRLFLVMFLAEPLFRLWLRRAG
ncbi:MAG: AbrB family transcriptional regulator [Stutzerimonas stutzeri]